MIHDTKPKEKPYKLADEKGLFLLVKPSGSKYWRFKYRFNGKEKLLAIGVYPDTSLSQAREKRDGARTNLTNGIDPNLLRQIVKRSTKLAAQNSFEGITYEWHTKFSAKWSKDHGEKLIKRSERNGVRAAYNYAEYLPERRKMMQHWADYLDALKASCIQLVSAKAKAV